MRRKGATVCDLEVCCEDRKIRNGLAGVKYSPRGSQCRVSSGVSNGCGKGLGRGEAAWEQVGNEWGGLIQGGRSFQSQRRTVW